MLNRPHNPLASPFGAGSSEEGSWRTDQNPRVRLGMLYVAMTFPLLLVLTRIVWLQTLVRERYVAEFEKTYIEFEDISSPDGRILAADGRVLAYDEERFQLLVHYRWLEEPPNADWLRKQAYARVAPRERRDAFLVSAAEAEVLQRREELWRTIAELTRRAPEEIAASRARIQQRVERIAALVNARHERAVRERERPPARPSTESNGWERLWERVERAVTTPPVREAREPILIREQLDDHPVIDDIPFEVVAEIEAHPERYPGLRVASTTRRIYPQGPLASHVVGHRARLSDDDFQEPAENDPLDYRPLDRKGVTGIERSYDRHLHGLRGRRKIVRNRMGEIVSSEIVREPRVGQDLVLTLDLDLQQRAERLLDDALSNAPSEEKSPDETAAESGPPEIPVGGCIVVLDVRTGKVLACANAPRHDLRLLTDFDAEQWQALLDDPRRPFFPRATQMTIPPGSTFKAVTAAAMLESGRIDPDEPFFCQGYLNQPERYRCYIYRHFGVGHGDVTLRDALAQSCNVYFFQGANRIGGDEIARWAARFGFGAPTGIDLPGERAGHLPQPATRADGRTSWPASETLGMSIGQSRVTATPMQVASLMATIANDGYRVTPYLAHATGMVRFSDEENFLPPAPRRVDGLSSDTMQRIREGLDQVVNSPRGTGYKTVRLREVRIAGKTGTAEVGPGKPDHAWFAGYVPADAPRYAFVVVLEHGGGGGKSAGPVAQKLVQEMLELNLLEPTRGPLAN